ncbi:hypothetical protein FJY90_08255 [Candidatus Gottesmanbacteria bacterium]|nr:hypothetical protein [Candidatus Gottesmanbacteria bacterium]
MNSTPEISKDLNLAAYFLLKGAKLLDIRRDLNHSVFIFADPDLCSQLRAEYFNGGQAPVLEFTIKRKELLAQIKGNDYVFEYR